MDKDKKKELTEEEKIQRAKNREKALKESRKKKDAKLKAKAKKQLQKKADLKAGKRARHKEARKASLESFKERFKKRLKRIFSRRNRRILIAFLICLAIGIAFYFAVNGRRNPVLTGQASETAKPEQKKESLSEEKVSEDKGAKKEEPSQNELKEETPKRELKKLSKTGKDTASSKEKDLQDIYPHEGGLYIMPEENDEESIKGQLMSTIILKKDEYEKMNAGDVIELDGVRYVILAINKEGEFGAAMSLTIFEEDKDYEKIIKEEESFEDYFGYENLVYGMTLAGEEAQIEMIGGTDYFADDGFSDDDMIFFAGTALYLPLCKSIDTGVTLYFDEKCELTVPDDTMLKDTAYDYKDYLKGENKLFPPNLMAAKIETEGDRIVKFNVMFVLPEEIEE